MAKIEVPKKTWGNVLLSMLGVGVLTVDVPHPLVRVRKRLDRSMGVERIDRGFEQSVHRDDPQARLSPFCFNLRPWNHPYNPGPLTQEMVRIAVGDMLKIVRGRGLTFDAVAGVPSSGDSFAEEMAERAEVEIIYLDKTRGEGVSRVTSIKNHVPKGVKNVLMVDNVVRRGGSMSGSLEVLRSAGLEVVAGVTFVDAQMGGFDRLDREGCLLVSACTAEDIFGLYHRARRVRHETFEEIKRYLTQAA